MVDGRIKTHITKCEVYAKFADMFKFNELKLTKQTVYKQEAMISLLDATNPAYIQFTGAKTVRIAKWQNGGLHDYYRNNAGDDRVLSGNAGDTDFLNNDGFGYQRSAARLVWEEFTLKCDRAAAYQIELFDNEESGEQLVGLGVSEISRTTIVPRINFGYCMG